MALSAEQLNNVKRKVGPPAYDAYESMFSETDIEELYTLYKGNYDLVGADMLDALASWAASVKEVKVGPITIKLNPETYTKAAARLRRAAGVSNVITSYRIRSIGTP